MNLYMAALSRDAAIGFNLGDGPDDDDGFEAAMAVFSGGWGLEIGKAWSAVDAVLRHDVADLEPFWVGEPVTGDLGHGPAFFASTESVQQIATSISGLTEVEAFRRLDAALHAGAVYYPAIWDLADELETNRRWAVDAIMNVVALYERAAANRLGMLSMIL
jgi:hypothetical protein